MSGDYKKLFQKRDLPVPVYDIDLESATDEELMQLSQESGIGLSLDEMKNVQDHFREKGRKPTDIEVEALGQAWSEHCCYKSSKVILKEHVFGIDAPQNIQLMPVTFDVSQPLMSRLNNDASRNIPRMVKTFDVFQPPIS